MVLVLEHTWNIGQDGYGAKPPSIEHSHLQECISASRTCILE
jgi:hypothetical protein